MTHADLTPRKIGHRDHTGGFRGFHFTPAAWYAKTLGKEVAGDRDVMIGIYYPEGGSSGEFAIREVSLGAHVALRLEVFDDAWSALALFPDLLALLAEHDSPPTGIGASRPRAPLTLDEMRPLLVSLGIKDCTCEVRPS